MNDVRDLDEDLKRLTAELIDALRNEPVPPPILDLAARLQAALTARATVPAEPE
ncbi:hypothetical protein [Falsirhodobacter sp. 20TX0035]|uniref:hypothetical protein n=1 Tax=Falsirhodobacter sp. 20TX0035 TaxID=3022019 RepID=UPI002330B2C4|nr:hypothetical protein [Falsirhodobacter sp. 20TX0035]MDB6452296.1 hypothetical protein [Falsirhodobacter sp. 20TX0035]